MITVTEQAAAKIRDLLAEQEAKLVDPQAYALVLDLAGDVCEAFPGHNFWIVDGDSLISPKSQAILRGITRDVLVEVAQKIGMPVKEADIQVYDVINAQEAFLSGTSRCIVPVTRVNGIPIGNPDQYWQDPIPATNPTGWVTWWIYDTGITLGSGQTMTIDFNLVVSHRIPDGFGNVAEPGQPLLAQNTCTITGA